MAGLIVSSSSLLAALICCRSLERCKTHALFCLTALSLIMISNVSLSSEVHSDLKWFIKSISRFNGKSFQEPDFDMYIETVMPV